jgi:hypothetical protein
MGRDLAVAMATASWRMNSPLPRLNREAAGLAARVRESFEELGA